MSKTILITGASSAIGKATTKLFHDKGWNVVATMRTPEKEEELTNLDNVFVTRYLMAAIIIAGLICHLFMSSPWPRTIGLSLILMAFSALF